MDIIEQTLCLIKPDATRHMRDINGFITDFGLKIVEVKPYLFAEDEAALFYKEHEGKHFFENLIRFITSGPVMVQILEGVDSISRWRALMGHSDPKKAAESTMRNIFGTDMPQNAVHGSDGKTSARREIDLFQRHFIREGFSPFPHQIR